MKMSEYIKLNKIPKSNKYKEWYTLDDEQLDLLEKAVTKYLPTKTKNVNYRLGTSYHLKHVFEDLLGFYVSNYDMKIVMDKLGYNGRYKKIESSGMNLNYNISKKELEIAETIAVEKRREKFKKNRTSTLNNLK